MKKILFFIGIMFISNTIMAQAPQGFNYQAVARDGSGNPLSEVSLTVRIGIINNSILLWQEDHDVATSSLGQFTIVIGDGASSVRSGGTLPKFSDIIWGAGQNIINVAIDDGSGFVSMGEADLNSVPYALYAEQSSNSIVGVDVASEEALFEVKRSDGVPVFAVYNDGVIVYVEESAKGVKGGFAVGGYNSASKGISQEYLHVTPDSIRMYINDNPPIKGTKGGFAVGGYNSTTKATTDFLMNVNRSNTQFYTGDSREGFTLGDLGSGDKPNYMKLTPLNYMIGLHAGQNLDPGGENATAGRYNTFIGWQAGMSDISGRYNLFIGNSSGMNNTGSATTADGNFNVFIGHNTGFLNTTGHENVFLGSNSGNSNTTGYENVFLGIKTGIDNTTGYKNVFIGKEAGANNTTGSSNLFIGQEAGFNNRTGNSNIFLGRVSGYTGTDHNNNIFIGDSTGYFTNNQFATKNVFMGYAAGKNTQSYNNVFIGNHAGYKNTGGQNNIAIGDEAGLNNISSQNIFIGTQAGRDNTDGYFNIIMGRWAGRSNTIGSHQIIIGGGAGGALTSGKENVIMGGNAGAVNTVGDGNIYLGYSAGWSNTGSKNIFIGHSTGKSYQQTVSNKLVIDNRASADPLIYGDFETDDIRFNATVGIGRDASQFYGLVVDGGTSSTYSMVVYKGAYAYTNGFVSASDARLKRDVKNIENALSKIVNLRGVNFKWDTENNPNLQADNEEQIGFIAQEVEKILPQVVSENGEGLKGISYDKLTALLVEGMKEQQAQIDILESKLRAYEALDAKVAALELKFGELNNTAAK